MLSNEKKLHHISILYDVWEILQNSSEDLILKFDEQKIKNVIENYETLLSRLKLDMYGENSNDEKINSYKICSLFLICILNNPEIIKVNLVLGNEEWDQRLIDNFHIHYAYYVCLSILGGMNRNITIEYKQDIADMFFRIILKNHSIINGIIHEKYFDNEHLKNANKNNDVQNGLINPVAIAEMMDKKAVDKNTYLIYLLCNMLRSFEFHSLKYNSCFRAGILKQLGFFAKYSRSVERKKPGKKKARKSTQFSKR